jgi:hypothetical protein
MEFAIYSFYSVAAITAFWLIWEFVGGALVIWDDCANAILTEASDEIGEKLENIYEAMNELLNDILPVKDKDVEVELWSEPTSEEEAELNRQYHSSLLYRTREQLRELCRNESIKNYGVMTKEQMIETLKGL